MQEVNEITPGVTPLAIGAERVAGSPDSNDRPSEPEESGLTEGTQSLTDRHRAELHASGLTDEMNAGAGFRSVRDGEIRDMLGWQPSAHPWGEGWAIPFPCDDGEAPYWRVKLDFPRHGRDGKPIKYESPRGATNRAYLPPRFREPLECPEVVVITEGEKKALAISQLGLPCIGFVGVWRGFAVGRLGNDLRYFCGCNET